MKRNYPQFYAICRAQGIDKEELVRSATGGRTEHLRDLSDENFRALLGQLQRSQDKQAWKPRPGDSQRKKMISIARSMGWGSESANPSRAIVDKLDAWCGKQKYKKPLMQHTVSELNTLLTIFETKVYASYLRGLNK